MSGGRVITLKIARSETNVVQALYEYNVAQDQLRRAIGRPEVPAAAR